MSVTRNYHQLLKRIEKAAKSIGKTAEDIIMVVAAKYASVEQLKEVINAGATYLGENRAQDLLMHQNSLGCFDAVQGRESSQAAINWHFIGHLQRNKINKVLDHTDMLQSLDNLRLAEALNKRLAANSHPHRLPVLIEVNIARDPAKFGISPESLGTFIKELAKFPTLEIQGLMTMGKVWKNEKEARKCFAKMRQLFENLKKLKIANLHLQHLSMGMSDDYNWAIEEGATMIRVGKLIFER